MTYMKTNLFETSGARQVVAEKGDFSIIEYKKDPSVGLSDAREAYFASEMNVRKRQLVISMSEEGGVFVQAGRMQLILGDIEISANVKGAGDLLKKFVEGAVTNESAVKPYYRGDGILVLEPTYRFILLEDLKDWPDGLVIEDGMFLACEESVDIETIGRKTLSSAVLGREGLINTALYGDGIAALESPVPKEEILVIDLEDDIIKIDGDMAIAWSPDLKFTVQKAASTITGSVMSGEGLVNVYEGTGRVLVAPVRNNKRMAVPVNE